MQLKEIRWGLTRIDNRYPQAISDGNEGCPHLVKVARQGTTALVDFLLERGADIEATDRSFLAHFIATLDPFLTLKRLN